MSIGDGITHVVKCAIGGAVLGAIGGCLIGYTLGLRAIG